MLGTGDTETVPLFLHLKRSEVSWKESTSAERLFGRSRQSTGDFGGSGTTLDDTVMVGMSLSICPNPENERYQEWILMWTMDGGWSWCVRVGASVVRNASIALVGDADNGVHMWRCGTRETSVPSAQFYCEHKTLLKHKVYFKIIKAIGRTGKGLRDA